MSVGGAALARLEARFGLGFGAGSTSGAGASSRGASGARLTGSPVSVGLAGGADLVARRRFGAASGASTLAAGTDSLAAIAAAIPASEAEAFAFLAAVLAVALAAVLVARFSTSTDSATGSVAVFRAAVVAFSLATTGEAVSAALDALLLAGFLAAGVGGASPSVVSGGAADFEAVFLAAARRATGGVVSVFVISSRPAAASSEVLVTLVSPFAPRHRGGAIQHVACPTRQLRGGTSRSIPSVFVRNASTPGPCPRGDH